MTEPDPAIGSAPARVPAAAAATAEPGALTTPASVLALQRSAGNAAVGRALRGRTLARQPTKTKPKSKSKGKAPKPKPPTPLRPRGHSKERLSKELYENIKTGPANYVSTGDWVHLVVDGRRIHVYDTHFLLVDSFRLKAVRLPQDGFYLSAFKGAGSKKPWFSSRLMDNLLNGKPGWAPIEFFADTDTGDSLWIQDWVVDDDKPSLLSALAMAAPPNGPDRIGMVVSRHSDRAKQMTRLANAISKQKGMGEGEGKAKEGKPARRLPDDVQLVEGRHGPHIEITLDGAHESVPFPDGASDEQLMEAVKRATEKVANEIDPATSVRVHGGAKKTGIKDDKQGLGTSEVALPAGFNPKPGGLAANTPGYPAKLISHGPGGDSGRESTVLGADLSFTMELNYAWDSYTLADETLNRAQNVAYQWELIDVSNVDRKALDEMLDRNRGKKLPDPADSMKQVQEEVAARKGKKTDSGITGTLKRDLSNTWEDTKADLEVVQRDPWKYQYLAVVAISDLVQIGGALIGAFFSMVSQPLNERKIEFNDEGVFFLRCFAWPIVDEDYAKEAHEEGKRLVIRAPSPALAMIDVAPINKRAAQSLDEREAAIADLRKELAEARDETARATAQSKLDATLISIGDTEALGRQTAAVNTELDRLGRWRELTARGTPLEERPDDLRIWHATLDYAGIDFAEYEERMLKAKKVLSATTERYTQFKLSDTKRNPIHPLLNFVSEETGEVYPLIANLVELKGPRSREGHRVWRLIDITSHEKQDSYEGAGETHMQAIRNAFVNFRENTEYGRGSLGIRLPAEQLEAITGEAVTVEPVMHVRPGERARALRRLSDLATAAEIASVVVTGPGAAAIRIAGAVAGGVTATENIRRRVEADRFSWTDPASYFDILGVVGAVVAVGSPLASGRAARTAATAAKARQLGITEDALEAMAKRAAWVDNSLHIVAKNLDRAQWIVIPASTYHELAQIEAEEQAERAAGRTPSPTKFRARRIEALARGVKSGMLQVYQGPAGAEPEAHGTPPHEPAPHPTEPPAPVHGEPPPTHGPPPHTPEGGGGGGGMREPPRPRPTEQTFMAPERPVASANTADLAQAMASGTAENRVRLISQALIEQFWAYANRGQPKPLPEGTVALRDPDTGHLYVAKEAFLGSPELRQATLSGVVASMNAHGREAISEPVARAYAERQLKDLVEGSPDLQGVTPEARGLYAELERIAGRQALRRALFQGDLAPLTRQLEAVRDQPRVRALLASLHAGNLELARRLAAEPNPALADQFSRNLYLAIGDLFAAQSGGQPVDPNHAQLAQHFADVVGQQVVERAYFEGDIDSLQAVLRAEVQDEGMQRFQEAMNRPRPDVDDARGVLSETSIRRLGTSADDIITRLQAEFDGLPDAATHLPPDWPLVREFLANSPVAANKRINQHIDTYVRGLQNPRLIMEVLSAAIRSAWAARRSINWALREMARVSAQARGIPLETIPHRGGRLFSNQDFFGWAFRPSYFVDLVLIRVGDHTANAHLVQDLVADRAFVRAGEAMSGPEFRGLLGQAQGTLVLSERANDTLPEEAHGKPVNIGQLIWYLLNDPYMNYLPRPEVLGALTRDTAMH